MGYWVTVVDDEPLGLTNAKMMLNKHDTPGDTPCGYYLQTPDAEFVVPKDEYFMLGDNTKYSSDSRIWGTVPRRNIVGKAFLVFWPFSRRWGLADSRDAYDVPTGESVRGTFPSMYLQ